MAKIDILRKHTQDIEQLRNGVSDLVERVGKKYSINNERNGDSWKLSGNGVREGAILLTQNEIRIQLDLLFFVPKGPVQSAIEEEMDRLFG